LLRQTPLPDICVWALGDTSTDIRRRKEKKEEEKNKHEILNRNQNRHTEGKQAFSFAATLTNKISLLSSSLLNLGYYEDHGIK